MTTRATPARRRPKANALGRLRWFGKSWGDPEVCTAKTHVATPVGRSCVGVPSQHPGGKHQARITEDDQGVVLPYVHLSGQVEMVQLHLKCWLYEIEMDEVFYRNTGRWERLSTPAPRNTPELEIVAREEQREKTRKEVMS